MLEVASLGVCGWRSSSARYFPVKAMLFYKQEIGTHSPHLHNRKNKGLFFYPVLTEEVKTRACRPELRGPGSILP